MPSLRERETMKSAQYQSGPGQPRGGKSGGTVPSNVQSSSASTPSSSASPASTSSGAPQRVQPGVPSSWMKAGIYNQINGTPVIPTNPQRPRGYGDIIGKNWPKVGGSLKSGVAPTWSDEQEAAWHIRDQELAWAPPNSYARPQNAQPRPIGSSPADVANKLILKGYKQNADGGWTKIGQQPKNTAPNYKTARRRATRRTLASLR